MAGTKYTASLMGGGPWGLILQGGKDSGNPLSIKKVTPGSKGAIAGVEAGDYVIKINGDSVDDMTHFEAIDAIHRAGPSLTLFLEKSMNQPADADERGSGEIGAIFKKDADERGPNYIMDLLRQDPEDDMWPDPENYKRIAEETEMRIDRALKMKKIGAIEKVVTPNALTNCKTNALFKAFEVNKQLKDLAERRGPEQEECAKLANSVSEFASAMINPLKSDACLREMFKGHFDVVLGNAIYWDQKKFISHPVVDGLLHVMWYGSFFDLSKRHWTESGYWRLVLLHIWALIDAFVFPFIFAPLVAKHLLLRRCAGKKRGVKRKDLYERYLDYFTTPCFVFVRDTLSYLTLLVLHFVICLSPSTVALSSLEWVVLVFFLGRILMEVQQFIDPKKTGKKGDNRKSKEGGNYVACSSVEQSGNDEVPQSSSSLPAARKVDVFQRNCKNYFSDQWNLLDFIILAIYTATFTLRVISWTVSVSVANNRLLAVAYCFYGFIAMLLTLRAFGHVMEGVRGMGTILIALFFIVRDVSAIFWQFIAAIVAFSIAITNIYVVERSYVSTRNATEGLVCSTDHEGIYCWWSVTKHLAWSLLGLADLDSLNSVDGPYVTLVHFLYSLFLVLGVIILVNMMIALLSNTYQHVQENSHSLWSFKKAVTIKTYRTYHMVPVPFNLLSVPALALYRVLKSSKYKDIALTEENSLKEWSFKKAKHTLASLEVIVKKLQPKYFATYGYSFPLTDQRKMDHLLYETHGNRQMANQICRRLFREPGFKQKRFETGANAWKSEGIQIDGCQLTCMGADFCNTCNGVDSQWHHGARYKKPFTKEMPRIEVHIQESGEKRILGVGAVFYDYNYHWMPGWRLGSAGYHADDGCIFHAQKSWRATEVKDAMAYRGDLMACELDFDHETDRSIPVKFFLNGREVGKATIKYTNGPKPLYPYIGMGKEGIRVLAKMCPRDENPGEEEEAFSFDQAKQEIKELRRETKQMFQAMQEERKKEMEELRRLIKTMDVKEK